MPIRAENRDRYPADWPEISARIRRRAEDRCEQCSVGNYALGGRLRDGAWAPAQPTGTDGMRLTWPRPAEFAWCQGNGGPEWLRIIRIVLTVAHLNHKPEDCSDENLRCLCQRCHNRLDLVSRRQGIIERQRAASAIGDLFAEPAHGRL